MEDTPVNNAIWTDGPPCGTPFNTSNTRDTSTPRDTRDARTENLGAAPAPSIGVLAWLRSRGRARPATGRRVLLVDPRAADDAVTLRRWGCEVTAMFSRRDADAALRQQLAAEGVNCIAGDFFDLKSSWKRSIDLVVMDMGPLPTALRGAAIRLFTECLAETGRLIVSAPEHSGLEESVRAAAGLLMMLSSESTFDPRGSGLRQSVVAERTGAAVQNAPLPTGLIRRFPV